MPEFEVKAVQQLVRLALAEDVGPGDVTSAATIDPDARAQAFMVAREPLVVCGLPVAIEVFQQCDRNLRCTVQREEGRTVAAGDPLLEVSGSAAAILAGERVALNFVQRLSGIATLTAQFVEAVAGTGAIILDTRKTTPGLRALEKYAVRCGGGSNHRTGLYDMVLVKDNHLAILRQEANEPMAAAVQRARARYPELRVELEADTLEDVAAAVAAGADRILLDNMPLAQLAQAVTLIAGRAESEASGGVRLETVRAIALTGVNYISAGALTHSARAVDVALDFNP